MAKWRPVDNIIKIIGSGRSVEAGFVPAGEDEISIKTFKGGVFPEGRLVVFAAPKSQTGLWIQDAELHEGKLIISMEGFDTAALLAADSIWTVSLGVVTDKGIVQYRLHDSGAAIRMRNLNEFFHDCRDIGVEPSVKFEKNGVMYEVYPIPLNKGGDLQLQVGTTEHRYVRAVSCAVTGVKKLKKGKYQITIQCPETLEQPQKIACLPDERTDELSDDRLILAELIAVDDYTKTHTVTGIIEPGEIIKEKNVLWILSCVAGYENGIPLHVPLYVKDACSALDIAEHLDGHPVSRSGDINCYLAMDNRRRFVMFCGKNCLGMMPLADKDADSGMVKTEVLKTIRPGHITTAALHVGGGQGIWRIKLPGREVQPTDNMKLLFENNKSKQRIVCDVAYAGGLVEADIRPLLSNAVSSRQSLWDVYAVISSDEGLMVSPLLDPGRIPETSRNELTYPVNTLSRMEEPIGEMLMGEITIELVPQCTFRGEWQISVADRCLRYVQNVRCLGTDVQIHSGQLEVQAKCPHVEGARWTGVVLTYMYQMEKDRKEYYCSADSVKEDGEAVTLNATVTLKDLPLVPVSWGIRLVFEKDGNRYWSPLSAPRNKRKRLGKKWLLDDGIKGLFFTQSINLTNGYQVSIRTTNRNNYGLSVQKRSPYSGFLFRLKERVAACVYGIRRKSLLNKGIFLVYETNCMAAQDNGYYFFRYCMENGIEKVMNRHIYYVIDRKQPDYNNLKEYKNHVIQFMSLRHMVYLLAARLLISSNSKQHSYAWRAEESIIKPLVLDNKRLVFLQHGVMALKRVDFFGRNEPSGADLFCVSNERERNIALEDLDYRPEQIMLTGLARWDVLEDKSADADRKKILTMPTWRSWLEDVSDDQFGKTEYFKNYMQFINSDRLAAYLEKYDLYLDFCIHPKLRHYIEQFSTSSDRIRLISFGEENINKLLMECKMLITDYSSVCWDVFYQNKPVLFFQFDYQKYNDTQGSYIDMEKDLFGDRATDENELLILMDEAAKTGFIQKNKYGEMRTQLFSYIDHQNSQRICEEIMRRGW